MAINTTGYSSNQFLNLTKGDKDTRIESIGIARTPDDNPEFYFPGKTTPNIYDKPGSKSTNTQIQRGFIRGIFPEVIDSIIAEGEQKTKAGKKIKNKYTGIAGPQGQNLAPKRRCFFQFNPSLILRSVQASTTTLNPLLQDPSQLLQPIPGQASFEFQLLFNREHEVSAQEYINGNGVVTPTSPLTKNLENYGASLDDGGIPYSPQQLGDLGVLVDLYVLDSIIGQSITADSIDSIRAYWEATKGLRPSDEVDKNGDPKQPYGDVDFVGKDSEYKDSLNKILGNSAFLNPMPIRIVFSSLFMVEGFVTASNVAFHKFSRNMVPTVCQVTLSVQAMYIGFARKNSYVSAQLTEAIKEDATNDQTTVENQAAALKLLNKHVQVDLLKMFYNAEYTGGDIYNGDKNDSLNKWFKTAYDADGVNFKAGRKGLGFGNLNQTPDTEDRDSIWMWTSQLYHEKNLTDAQFLKIENFTIYFYDTKKLPKECNTLTKLIEKAEKGQLRGGVSGDIKYQARSRIWWRKLNNGPFASDTTLLISQAGGDDAPNKFEDGLRESPYKIDWLGDDIRHGDLDPESLQNPDKYFGDEVIVLVICRLSAESKKAGGGDNLVNYVYKAAGVKLNPNTDTAGSITAVPRLTFGAR